MTDTQQMHKSIVDIAWDWLSSVKLAIIIFALISLTAVMGTVIEQNAPYENNIQVISKFVGMAKAPSVYKVLDFMGFMDMYRSWWFNLLLAAFASNLIICSIDHFPPRWRLAREKLKPLKEEQFRSFSIKKEFFLKGKADELKKKLTMAVEGLGFKKHEAAESGDGWQVFGQHQQYSRLGVYITHLSIIVIMAGAVVEAFLGFSGFLNIPEGAAYPIAFSRKQLDDPQNSELNMLVNALLKSNGNLSQAAASLGVAEDVYVGRLRFLGAEPLGFMVKNEGFEVDFYGQSDTAKEYSSLLVVYDQGREVLRKRIEVNDPLKYKGFTLHQSSYGMMGNKKDFIFLLKAQGLGSAPERHEVKLGDTLTMPGSGMKITLQDFSPALRFDSTGRPTTYADMMNYPGIQVKVDDGETVYQKWIMKRNPQTWDLSGNSRLEFTDVRGAQFAVLLVRRDPGLWIIYLGSLIMSIGLYMAFFTSHRRLWIKLTGVGSSGARVLVAGCAHKGREGFESRIDRMITLLAEGGK